MILSHDYDCPWNFGHDCTCGAGNSTGSDTRQEPKALTVEDWHVWLSEQNRIHDWWLDDDVLPDVAQAIYTALPSTDDKDQRIKELEFDNDVMTTQTEGLCKKLKEQDQRIAELERDLKTAWSTAQDNGKEKFRNEQTIAALESKIAMGQKEIDQLVAALRIEHEKVIDLECMHHWTESLEKHYERINEKVGSDCSVCNLLAKYRGARDA